MPDRAGQLRAGLAVSAAALAFAPPAWANTGWAGMHLERAQVVAIPVVIASIFIEAWFLRRALLRPASNACAISAVANGISYLVGAFCTKSLISAHWHEHAGTITDHYLLYAPIVAWLFVITIAIELVSVRLLYRIPFRFCAVPLCAGNLVTHAILLVASVYIDRGRILDLS